MKRRFRMTIIIDGFVDVSDELTLEELNRHLSTDTEETIKKKLSNDLDVPENIIAVESSYE
jgi:hypothetical protein